MIVMKTEKFLQSYLIGLLDGMNFTISEMQVSQNMVYVLTCKLLMSLMKFIVV